VRLLITRPRAEAQRTALELAKRGYDALIAPMLAIEPVKADFNPASFDAIIITSGNAVRSLVQSALQNSLLRPVLAVGSQTAQAARDAGFTDVTSADGDGADLVSLIRSRLTKTGVRLLYLAGNDRSRDLAADLAKDGIHIETVIVYSANAAVRLPDDAQQALRQGTIDGVLHYSRRSTAIFLECADAAGLDVSPLRHYCLSQRAAEPLSARGFKIIRIAPRPDEAALLDLIAAGWRSSCRHPESAVSK
jgi:uroporphyrinogen-III synthase